MKKMLAIIMLAATIQSTYALFVHEVPAEKDHGLTPTEFVIQALGETGVSDLDTLLLTLESIQNRQLSAKGTDDEQGMSAEVLIDVDISAELEDGSSEKKVVAYFSMDGAKVRVKSDISIVDSDTSLDDEALQKIKAELESNGSSGAETKEDNCTKCRYEWTTALNDLSRESTCHIKASCETIIDKKDLIAKVDKERAEFAKLKALMKHSQKNQNQDSK